jgi:hypothetical protein
MPLHSRETVPSITILPNELLRSRLDVTSDGRFHGLQLAMEFAITDGTLLLQEVVFDAPDVAV